MNSLPLLQPDDDRTPPEMYFTGLESAGGRLRLAFSIAHPDCDRPATVLVLTGGTGVNFPHCLDESGETLGCDYWDARLRAQALETRAMLIAASEWIHLWRGPGR